MRFATDSNHGNGRQHDCRKPKRRSPGRSSSGRQPRERVATTDPKDASGERETAILSDPPLETAPRGFSNPLKGIIGTANGVADGKVVCKITHYEQRGDHQAAGTRGLGPRGRQGRSRQVQAPRQAGSCGGATSAQGSRARHLAQHFPAGGLGVGLRCCIPCTCTPAMSATPTA